MSARVLCVGFSTAAHPWGRRTNPQVPSRVSRRATALPTADREMCMRRAAAEKPLASTAATKAGVLLNESVIGWQHAGLMNR